MTLAWKMDNECSRLRGRSERGKEMRVWLRAKESETTKDKVIEIVFYKTEVRIFGDFPNYVALCKENYYSHY